MKRISEQAIIEKIKQREIFSATIEGGAFSLKIKKYEPALCAAIHNGGNLRSDIKRYCLLSQKERYYEEDPFTGSFIEQQAITLIAHDSRYEYDLNRNLLRPELIRGSLTEINYRVKMSIQEHYSSLTSVVFFPSDFFPVSSGYRSFVVDHYPFLAATRYL
ncbi:MAG: hypothetical protein IEMM0001_0569 [bacterium]|nr:MAG: hypothetical protein IEMM0001_0569 [bacterium]